MAWEGIGKGCETHWVGESVLGEKAASTQALKQAWACKKHGQDT